MLFFKTVDLILLSAALGDQVKRKHGITCGETVSTKYHSAKERGLLSGTAGVWGRRNTTQHPNPHGVKAR